MINISTLNVSPKIRNDIFDLLKRHSRSDLSKFDLELIDIINLNMDEKDALDSALDFEEEVTIRVDEIKNDIISNIEDVLTKF